MGLPNVGVTGVIQDQGFGGSVGAGAGGLAQFLMGLEKIRSDDANSKAMIALEKQKQEFAQQQAAAALAEQQRMAQAVGGGLGVLSRPDRAAGSVEIPSLAGMLGGKVDVPGFDRVEAAFQSVPEQYRPAFAESAKEILKSIADERQGVVVGGQSRLVNARTGAVTVGIDRTLTATDQSTGFRDFLATLRLPPDTNPNTLTPDQSAAFDRYTQRQALAGGTRQIFNMGNSVAAAMAPVIAGRARDAADNAASAAADLSTISELEALLQAGTVTGFGAESRLKLSNFLTTIGVEPPSRTANSQAYKAVVGRRVAEIIKAFGAGTGLSDADREYANNMAGGNIEINDAATKKIFAIGKRAAGRTINEGNRQAQNVPEEYRQSFMTPVPGGGSTAQTGTANSDGRVNYGGKMYEMILREGKWQINTPDGWQVVQ